MRTIPIDERSSLLLQQLADVAFDLDQTELREFWRINYRRVMAADGALVGRSVQRENTMAKVLFAFSDAGLRRIREAAARRPIKCNREKQGDGVAAPEARQLRQRPAIV